MNNTKYKNFTNEKLLSYGNSRGNFLSGLHSPLFCLLWSCSYTLCTGDHLNLPHPCARSTTVLIHTTTLLDKHVSVTYCTVAHNVKCCANIKKLKADYKKMKTTTVKLYETEGLV